MIDYALQALAFIVGGLAMYAFLYKRYVSKIDNLMAGIGEFNETVSKVDSIVRRDEIKDTDRPWMERLGFVYEEAEDAMVMDVVDARGNRGTIYVCSRSMVASFSQAIELNVDKRYMLRAILTSLNKDLPDSSWDDLPSDLKYVSVERGLARDRRIVKDEEKATAQASGGEPVPASWRTNDEEASYGD